MIVIAAMLVALLGARVAAAQTVASLKIISGDGQVVSPAYNSTLQFFQPITVQALDANGNGVANATITWTVKTGQATVGPTNNTSGTTTTTTTDPNGMSTTPLYQTGTLLYGTTTLPYLLSTIVANSGNPSATFYETYALIDRSGNSMVTANAPTMNGQLLGSTVPSGNSGSTLPNIQVFVGGEGLAADGVPNVAVQLLLAPGQTTLATITCAPSSSSSSFGNPGAVLSGPDGNATCTPVLGGSGTGRFYVIVGGVATPTSTAGGGTVNTSGTDVTWVSGADFSALVQNQQIRINGVEYVVASVNSQTDLTLASTAGNQNGVPWLNFQPLFLQQFGPYTFTSNPGAAAAIKKVQGDGQALAPGQSLGTLIAQVVDSNGNGIPGLNVSWSANPNKSVALSQPTNPTDNNGQVSLVASFSSVAAGNVDITVSLAGYPAISATFTETAVVPITQLLKISGDAQSAVVGTAFANPLVVQVNGSNVLPITNYPVQFSSSGPGILSSPTTVLTNNSGQAQITVTAGSGPGTVLVTASVAGFSKTFTLTVLPTGPTPNGITIVSGNPQSAVINTNFPAPLIVQVNSSAGPVGNYTVTFSSSALVTLSAASGTTNSAGQTSVTATAGSATGAATVTASIPGYFVTFNLTVSPPIPIIPASAFANAASGQVGFISPCGIATITAAGLDPNGAAGLFPPPVFGPLPTSANGISVAFTSNNIYYAPIFSATLVNGQPQLMVQVPCEVTPAASVPVTVNVGAGSAAVNVQVLAAAPGIFQVPYSDGALRAVALRADGSFVSLSNPARRTEIVRVYVTGLGPTVPSVGTGQVDNPGADLIGADALATGTVIVGISGSGGATVTSARIGANMIGVFEVAFIVPANAPQGNNIGFSVGVVPAGSINAINSVICTIPIQ